MNARVVGYVGADVPVELIFAAQAVPKRLYGFNVGPTPRADQYLERAFLPEIRQIAERWLEGQLDDLDTVIFSRSSDSAQRLYYYLCELQRRGQCGGPRPLLYDVAKVQRASSLAHTIEATRILARELGSRLEHLSDAVRRVEVHEAALAGLAQLRCSDPPLLGSYARQLAISANSDWSLRIDSDLTAHRASGLQRRVLLAGSAPPNESLHLAVESVGGCIVGECLEGEFVLPSRVPRRADHSIESIATYYRALPTTARAFINWPAELIAQVHATHADAVLIYLVEEEEAHGWELPAQLRALQSAGVRVLALTRQAWPPNDEALRQVAAFVQDLEKRA